MSEKIPPDPRDDDKKRAAALEAWRESVEKEQKAAAGADATPLETKQQLHAAVHSFADLEDPHAIPDAETLADSAAGMMRGEQGADLEHQRPVNEKDPNIILHRGMKSISDDTAAAFRDIQARADAKLDAAKAGISSMPTSLPPTEREINEKAASDAIREVDAGHAADLAAARAIAKEPHAPKTYDSAAWRGESTPEKYRESFEKFKNGVVFLKDRGLELSKRLVAATINIPGRVTGDILSGIRALGNGESLAAINSGAERTKKYLDYFRKSDDSFGKKLGKFGGDVYSAAYSMGENYRKLPLEYKILLSIGFFSASVATGGVGVFTGAITGAKAFQRSMSGLGTYTLVDALVEKKMSSKEEATGEARSRFAMWKKRGLAAGAAGLVMAGIPGIKALFGAGEDGASWLYNSMPHGALEHAAPATLAGPNLNFPKIDPFADIKAPSAPDPYGVYKPFTMDNGLNAYGPIDGPVEVTPGVAPGDLAHISPTPDGHHVGDVRPMERPLHHDTVHHERAAAHRIGLTPDQYDHLETEFLNKWQVDHGGTPDTPSAMPSAEQINTYIAENSSRFTHHAAESVATTHAPNPQAEHIDKLNAQRAKLNLRPLPNPDRIASAAPSAPLEAAVPAHVAPQVESAGPDMTHITQDQPIHSGVPTNTAPQEVQPQPAPSVTAPAEAVPSHVAEASPAPIEHTGPFVNHNGTPVDPSKPGQYSIVENGTKEPYFGGGQITKELYDTRYNMALKFATEHPGTRVVFDATTPDFSVSPGGEPFKHLSALTVRADGSLVDEPVLYDSIGKPMPIPDWESVNNA